MTRLPGLEIESDKPCDGLEVPWRQLERALKGCSRRRVVVTAELERAIERVNIRRARQAALKLRDLGFRPSEISPDQQAPGERHARHSTCRLGLLRLFGVAEGCVAVARGQVQARELDLRGHGPWIQSQDFVIGLDGVRHLT